MFGDTFGSSLKTWRRVLQTSLGGGNQITSARLHAVQMMVEGGINTYCWEGQGSDKLELMDALVDLCSFAKENGSAAEKTIFLHIMIDLIDTYEREHATPPRRLMESIDGFGDPYPPEDSPEYLIPPAELGDIPF